jgi:hypothetical protein
MVEGNSSDDVRRASIWQSWFSEAAVQMLGHLLAGRFHSIRIQLLNQAIKIVGQGVIVAGNLVLDPQPV